MGMATPPRGTARADARPVLARRPAAGAFAGHRRIAPGPAPALRSSSLPSSHLQAALAACFKLSLVVVDLAGFGVDVGQIGLQPIQRGLGWRIFTGAGW